MGGAIHIYFNEKVVLVLKCDISVMSGPSRSTSSKGFFKVL